MNGPLVSIITPAYNAAKFIAATIRSVQAQTVSDWEMIIVNDGSKDDTEAVIAPFLSDSRIRVVAQANSGVCAARNNGFSNARGKYIALLDADDLMMPENLAKKTLALESDPGIAWVYSNLHLVDAEGNTFGPDTKGKGENVLENLLLWNGEVIPGPCSNLVFRSSLTREGFLFDKTFSTAADQDFCMRLAAKHRSVFLPEPLASYRILPNSMSRNIAVMEKDHIGVYRKAAASGLFRSGAFRRKCFSNLYLVLAGSWWVNGKNKWRGMQFMLRAVLSYPPAIGKLFRKITGS